MTFLSQAKTTMYLAILSILVIYFGFLLGGEQGITIAFIIVLLFNFFSYWYSDKIVLKLYRAKKADYSSYESLHNLVKQLAERASIPKPEIFIIDSQQPNAFATGRNKKHAAVAFTKGILDKLSENELKGVVAHELSHIKNNDILISTIASVLAGAIAYVAIMARWALIFGRERDNIFGVLIISLLAPFIALILRMAISRSREYLADSTGAKLTKDPNSLAEALTKLDSSNEKMNLGNNATSALFISNPFKEKRVFNLFSTHPPMESRIRKLRNMHF